MWFAWQIYPLSFILIAKPIFSVPLQYPTKTAENRRFSVFRVYGSGTLVENWLIEGRGKKILIHICDALRDLVPFAQFEKREKHPWRSVNFSHSSMGVFHDFQIVQMVPNRATHHIFLFWQGTYLKGAYL